MGPRVRAQPLVESFYPEDFPRAQGAYIQPVGFLEKSTVSLLQLSKPPAA